MKKQYSNLGAICADKNNIFDVIESLKKREFKRLVVINNRYDGIDLPDESCRVLIMNFMWSHYADMPRDTCFLL